MSKKTGRKARYEVYAGAEIKDILAGKEIGISFDRTTKNYYTMLPSDTRTRRQWLGSDIGLAVARFKAIVDSLKGKTEKYIDIAPDRIKKRRAKLKNLTYREIQQDGFTVKYRPSFDINSIPESLFYEWLREKIQNPKELAQKSGIEAIASITTALAETRDIVLKDLIKKYLNKAEKISLVEERNCIKAYNEFLNIIECSKLSQVCIEDVDRYEKYIHKLSISPVSKKNKINKVGTILNYCTKKIASHKLFQLYKWIQGIERPKDTKPYNPIVVSLEDFNKLFEVSELKYQVMLLMALNCGMYPVDLCKLKLINIDFIQGTIAFRRGKTGKVLAVSTLWKRTKELLEKYLSERKGKSDYVFISYLGKDFTPKGITSVFDRNIREKAGVSKSVKFNHLRDTFSTLAQDLGYSIEQINLVLGHRNKGMQDRYAVRHASELTKEMCCAVENTFFNAGGEK